MTSVENYLPIGSYKNSVVTLIFVLAALPLYFLITVILNPENSERWYNYINYSLGLFLFYAPLGIVGIWKWGVWAIKKTYALSYNEIIPNAISLTNPTFSIVTAVFNEKRKTFEDALISWDKNNPNEIIAVIDHTDLDCIDVFTKFSKGKSYAKLIVTSKIGKREAIADGISKASEPIVALVDSDTIWSENLKEKALAPFQFHDIGGVTVRCHPIEVKTIYQKMTDFVWDARNFYDLPSQTTMGHSLTCLTGRTSFYRRKILLPKLEIYKNEILFGVKKESGDDKCLTRLLQLDGWKTYYQRNAVVFSSASKDFKTFMNQRIRWSRNSHNSDMESLLKNNAWERFPSLAFYMTDRFFSIFTIFLGPIYLGLSIYLNHWFITYTILILWFVGRGIRTLPHLQRKPKDLIFLPVFIVFQFISGLAKLYALVTLKDQEGIRDRIKIKNKQIVEYRQIKGMIITAEVLMGMAFLAYLGL